MKLRFSPTSPFARKVVVSAIETGLDKRIERVATDTADPKSGLGAENPLGKVPSLTLDDGGVLFDSRVICEYLDGLHDGPKLFPAAGPARWTALRRQALGDGICDAAVLARMEVVRPPAEQSASWIAKQKGKVAGSLDALEAEAGRLGEGLDIGLIAIGCALAYLDLRFAADAWRDRHPRLAGWFERFAERPAMKATAIKSA
jgi:glutathione S-transferase